MTATDVVVPEGDRLLTLALERGTELNVEIIERIVALKERNEDREAARAIHEAVAAFQADVPAIPKSKVVSYASRTGRDVRYSYAPLDAIADAIRSALHTHGLAYTWDSSYEEGRVVCTCTVRHIHGAKLSAVFGAPIDTGDTKMSGPQRTAAALTYARRQSLVQVLGLTSTDDDTDAEGTPVGHAISDAQRDELQIFISESGADISKFCELLEVDSLKDLDAGRFDEALGLLRQKLKQKRAQQRGD